MSTDMANAAASSIAAPYRKADRIPRVSATIPAKSGETVDDMKVEP